MPEIPSGLQFLVTAIANLHGELAAAFDALKAKDARIAALEAAVAKLNAPESDGA